MGVRLPVGGRDLRLLEEVGASWRSDAKVGDGELWGLGLVHRIKRELRLHIALVSNRSIRAFITVA